MNAKQKKIIIGFTLFILFGVAISGIIFLIYGFVSKDEIYKLVGMISSVVSPSMLIGIGIKFLLNKYHIRNLKTTLHQAGLKDIEITPKEEKQAINIFRHNNYLFVEKEGRIIIKYENNNELTEIENFNELNNAITFYLSDKRKRTMIK